MICIANPYCAVGYKYPVENFHSVLRARTDATDDADQMSLKAKEIDTCKHEMHSFKFMFVSPKKFNFSRKTIEKLKAMNSIQKLKNPDSPKALFMTLHFVLKFVL